MGEKRRKEEHREREERTREKEQAVRRRDGKRRKKNERLGTAKPNRAPSKEEFLFSPGYFLFYPMSPKSRGSHGKKKKKALLPHLLKKVVAAVKLRARWCFST